MSVSNVSGMSKEMQENPVIQVALMGLKSEIQKIFDIIDEDALPKSVKNIPDDLKGYVEPTLKIQYANMLQTAFNEVYKEYITKCSTEFSNNMMLGGIK